METENKDSDAVKQLQETLNSLSERLIGQFKVNSDAFKQLQETLNNLVDHNTPKQLQETLNSLVDRDAFKQLSGQFEAIKKTIQRSISPNFVQVLKELPHKTKQVYLKLAERGWFLYLDLTPKETLQLTDGSAEEVEKKLIELYNSSLSEIKQSIIEKYPRRKKIIEAAFNAHHREEYELSIPVLLAQADGICKEKIGKNIFMGKERKVVARYVEQIDSETIIAAVLSPLKESLPIWKSKRTNDFNELNRHMVLHGESLNYGTKTNSLKAISLTNYVAEVLGPLRRRMV